MVRMTYDLCISIETVDMSSPLRPAGENSSWGPSHNIIACPNDPICYEVGRWNGKAHIKPYLITLFFFFFFLYTRIWKDLGNWTYIQFAKTTGTPAELPALKVFIGQFITNRVRVKVIWPSLVYSEPSTFWPWPWACGPGRKKRLVSIACCVLWFCGPPLLGSLFLVVPSWSLWDLWGSEIWRYCHFSMNLPLQCLQWQGFLWTTG